MLQKLILLITTAIILTACGASAPEYEMAMDEMRTTTASGYGVGEGQTDTPAETTAAADTAETAEYFLFEKRTNSVVDCDGTTILYENQCMPTFTSADPARSEWVGELLDSIDQEYTINSDNLYTYANEFIEENGTEYFYSYSNYQQIGVARHDEAVVSLIALSSLYSGGTHPNSVQTAYNLDIENRRMLRLEDLIDPSGAEPLAKMVRTSVEEKFSSLGLFEDYGSTIATSMTYGSMTPYWYLNDKGLVVFYNQYELGPYAVGIIKVELSYADLEGIILEEYLPVQSSSIPGDLVMRGDWEGYQRIPITIEAEGETLLIGVEGQVHQVQLSEVLWLENTPIGKELLFSAMSLGQNDVLQITGGYTDEGRSFAIEFLDGSGEQKIYYLHTGELTEDP